MKSYTCSSTSMKAVKIPCRKNCQEALKSGMIMSRKEVWKGTAIKLDRSEQEFVNL